MGSITGAAIVSHHPGLFRPLDVRIDMGNGTDSDLVAGFERLRARIDEAAPDVLMIIDTHWFTTGRHIVAGREHYRGRYTSGEMPWILHDIPYDYRGDPELADTIGRVAEERDVPFWNAVEDGVEPEYPTVNLLEPLCRGERILRVGICQNARGEHFLEMGAVLGEAIRRSGRKVVILASGALSHRMTLLDFQLRNPRAWHPDNISNPDHMRLDQEVIASWENGDHAAVIDRYDELRAAAYEGLGGHYLQMVGALGGRDCRWVGTRLSEYENAMGTANIHIWFDDKQGESAR